MKVSSLSMQQLINELSAEERKYQAYLATLSPAERAVEEAKRKKEHEEAVQLAESLGIKLF